jgi:hypothetical protein
MMMMIRLASGVGWSVNWCNHDTVAITLSRETAACCTMDEETTPPSARALLPCLLPLDTLKMICEQNLLVLEPVETLKELWIQEATEEEVFPWKE